MKKVWLAILCLLLINVSAEAAEKLRTNILSATGDVSTDNVPSRLISATIAADPRDTNYAILSINNGSTEKYRLSTTHATASIVWDRDTAPPFSTDITATITTDGSAKASFSYIELD